MEIQTTQLVSSRKARSSSPSLIVSSSKKSSLSQSIANVEELLFAAEAQGNTRKANALRLILKRFKKMAEKTYFFH